MRAIRIASICLARFFLSAIFLASAIKKLFVWHDMEKLTMNILFDWQTYLGFSSFAQEFFAALVSCTPLLLIVATLLELIGGLLLLTGIKEKLGACLLLVLLVVTTVLAHPFWFIEGSARELQQVIFLKNLSILGGLILVLLHGAKSPAKESGGFGGSIKFS